MSKLRAVYSGYQFTPTYITDTTPLSSELFDISEFPTRLTAGKNLIKFRGNANSLKIGASINVEVLDFNGDPIYSEFIDYVDEDGSRVIAIHVYEDTPPGDATITMITQVKDSLVTKEWENSINAKWIRSIPVNPTISNISEIIFSKEPNVTVSENIGVRLDRTYETSQFPTYTFGAVEYLFQNNQPVMTITKGKFTGDMQGGTITVSSPVNPKPDPIYSVTSNTYTTKIKKILSDTTVQLETPFTVTSKETISTHTYNQFEPSTFSLSYEAAPTYATTEHSESFALLQINGLDPSTGDISRIKVYANSKGTVGTWEQINDVALESTEIFVDSTASLTPDASLGMFTTQSVIDTYWEGHVYLGNTESFPAPKLSWQTSSINNAMNIFSNETITAPDSVIVTQVQDQYAGFFVSQSEYRVVLDAYAMRSKFSDNNDPKLSIYASGSAFNFDTTNILNQQLPITVGKKIGEITSTGDTQRYDDIEFEFKADKTGNGSLLFVIESGLWQIADIRTETSAEIGYTPNYTRIRSEVPTKHKSDNQISFKVEYYNIIGDRSKTVSYIYDKDWQGGNRYIDGGFSMITGSLYVADSLRSGIEINGLRGTGYIRSLGYEGFNQATGSGGQGGFVLFSGSALPQQTETTYSGVGLEMVADANNYFRFRTDPPLLDIRTETIFLSGSDVNINTPNFFLGVESGPYISGSSGVLEISSSNFMLKADGTVTASNASFEGVALANIIRDRAVVITAANSGSYLQYNSPSGTPLTPGYQPAYYNLKLDGTLGGEKVRRAVIGCPLRTVTDGLAGTYIVALAGVTLPQISAGSSLECILEISGSGITIRNDVGPFEGGKPA